MPDLDSSLKHLEESGAQASPSRVDGCNPIWLLDNDASMLRALGFASMFVMVAAVLSSCDNKPQDTLVRLDTLPSCSSDFTSYKDFVVNNQFGISVQNLYHHNIFLFDSKIAPWRPINGYRATVSGRFYHYEVDDSHNASSGHDAQCEYDWNIDVTPGPAFVTSMSEGSIECEITPASSLRNNSFFPQKGHEDECVLVGKNICVYGPWVRDIGNDSQQEIHPTEAIWWQNVTGSNSDIELVLVQDAACHRFAEIADYDFDEDHDGTNDYEAGWVPWVQYPQTEEIKIPFQYDSHTGRYIIINIEEVKSSNIVTALYPELADTDDGTDHKLKATSRFAIIAFNQPILAEVQEGSSTGPNLGIQFTDLCKSSTGIISGNIRVLTAIGHANTRDAGYIVLRFRISSGVNDNGQISTQ